VASSPGDPLKVNADVTRQAKRRRDVWPRWLCKPRRERGKTESVEELYGMQKKKHKKGDDCFSDAGRSCHEYIRVNGYIQLQG